MRHLRSSLVKHLRLLRCCTSVLRQLQVALVPPLFLHATKLLLLCKLLLSLSITLLVLQLHKQRYVAVIEGRVCCRRVVFGCVVSASSFFLWRHLLLQHVHDDAHGLFAHSLSITLIVALTVLHDGSHVCVRHVQVDFSLTITGPAQILTVALAFLSWSQHLLRVKEIVLEVRRVTVLVVLSATTRLVLSAALVLS